MFQKLVVVRGHDSITNSNPRGLSGRGGIELFEAQSWMSGIVFWNR